MSTQEIPSQADFRERAKTNDVPIARLIGFEAKDIADGRATVVLAAGPQHANPMGTPQMRCFARSDEYPGNQPNFSLLQPGSLSVQLQNLLRADYCLTSVCFPRHSPPCLKILLLRNGGAGGCMKRNSRKRGPDVRQFRWSEIALTASVSVPEGR
jgi:hypothetical protein